MPSSRAREVKIEKLANQQQSLLPSSLQEKSSDVSSYDQISGLCPENLTESSVGSHVLATQSYNRRNSYSTEEDEEYVHEFDSEFVGLNSWKWPCIPYQFSSARTGVRTETMEQLLRRRTCRAEWR